MKTGQRYQELNFQPRNSTSVMEYQLFGLFSPSYLYNTKQYNLFGLTRKTQSWQSKKSWRLLDLMITGDHYNNNPPLSGLI